MLGSHRDAIAVGEGWKLNQAVAENNECTCGLPIRECPFWAAVTSEMEQEIGWNPFSQPGKQIMHRRDVGKLRSIFLIAAEKIVGRLGARVPSRFFLKMVRNSSTSRSVATTGFALQDACLKVSERKIAVDSGKDAFRVDAMFRLRPEQSKIVVLVRDGRGGSASRLGKGRNPSRANHPTMRSAANQWKKENLQTLAVVEQFPENAWMLQRYEEFCESPETVMNNICSFAGIEFDNGMLRFSNPIHHNLIGNRMRFSKENQIQLDDAWRENLSPKELSTFDQVAGALNRRFGFSAD